MSKKHHPEALELEDIEPLPIKGHRMVLHKAHLDKQLFRKNTMDLMRVIGGDIGESRFVGGCVRNSLMRVPIKDIDIATILKPDEVRRRVEAIGMKCIDTGLKHGTVTVVAETNGVRDGSYEVTTLRRDVSTDGRHAEVEFTDSFKEDAMRRDFTMNALYATIKLDGYSQYYPDSTLSNVYDYTDGIEDIKNGIVRFIGNPEDRIKEDYLRMLRYFRFHARYGREKDYTSLDACIKLKHKLKELSGERIQTEMFNLFQTDSIASTATIKLMAHSGILDQVLLSDEYNLDMFIKMCDRDKEEGEMPDPLLRLGSLLTNIDHVTDVSERWRLSNAQRNRLLDMHEANIDFNQPITKNIYLFGKQVFNDVVRLNMAKQQNWRDMLEIAKVTRIPNFPISGNDIIAMGYDKGPQIGSVLSTLETKWVNDGFPIITNKKAWIEGVLKHE